MRFPILLLFTALVGVTLPAGAQELLVSITPQVLEEDHSVSWEQPLSKLTRDGTPVIVNIDAEGLTIRVSVTPFTRGDEFLLVVEGEVHRSSGSGVRLSSSVQSRLVPSGESIAYFPLGRSNAGGRQMLILIRVEPAHE